jgi:hypothetical protein
MSNFKERYGEFDHETGEYTFSNVRTGLIVGLVHLSHGRTRLNSCLADTAPASSPLVL